MTEDVVDEVVGELSFDTRDEYQRKPIAEKVIQLLTSDAQVSPMIIDGSWGTGKSEFCKKLIHLIENSDVEIKPVYIDAFKADHADESLMTLLAAVLKLLPEAEQTSLIDKALPVARFGLKTGFKAGVSWLLRQDAADLGDDLEKEIKKAGDEAINHAVQSTLKDHVAVEQSIKTLQEALKSVAQEQPIVIFIDELDRCRPDFAVAMLESIKHIFDVEGVQFVLVTNTSQLKASINHCYGAAIDAHRYLDKFLMFSFTLPDTFKYDRHNNVLASIHHLRVNISSSDLLANINLDRSDRFLKQLVSHNRMSLREIETFVRYLEIYQTLTEGQGFMKDLIFGYQLLRLFGIFLFCFKPECADKIVRGYVDAEELASTLGKSELLELSERAHPDLPDLVVAIVGLEASHNKAKFVPESEEIRQHWNQIIDSIFRGASSFMIDEGERSKIIGEAIEVLRLGAQ